MRFIILSKGYPPSPSPSGSLIKNVADACAQVGKVYVITRNSASPPHSRYDLDGATVIGVRDTSEPGAVAGPERRGHVLRRLHDLWAQGRTRLLRLTGSRTGRQERRLLVQQLRDLELRRDDIVIPCTPVEIDAALEHRAEADFQLFPFLLEVLPQPPAAPLVPSWMYAWAQRRLWRREERILSRSSHTFALPAAYRALALAHPTHTDHLTAVEHPMLRDLTHSSSHPLEPGCPARLVYAGGLDQRSRNPTYALEVLRRAHRVSPLEAHFYSYGNCEVLLRAESYQPWLVAHGRVPPESAIAALQEADFHLTQANAHGSLVPSKIFDCMSTGKPVIHFYHEDSDPYLAYLDRYHLGCVIRIGTDLDEAARTVAQFLDANRGRSASYDQIVEEFPECTPGAFLETVLAKSYELAE